MITSANDTDHWARVHLALTYTALFSGKLKVSNAIPT